VCPDQFQPGFTAWGSFAEQVAIDYADVNLVGLPDNVDFVTAASLGCRFGTAFRAVVDQGQVTAGDWVAVHGCGGVGASALMIAAAIGARPIAVDIREEALALAREVGAAWTLHAEEEGAVAERIRQKTSGGAHVSLDALGSAETCANSVSCLRPRGRHVQVGLMVGADREANLPLDRVVADELELRGTHGVQAHRYPALLELVRSETLTPQQLVRRTLTLDQAGAALMQLGSEPGPGIQVIDTFD
jgi:alcohol dehydrogenase